MNEVIPHLFQRAQAWLAQLGLDSCHMFDFCHTAFFSGSLFHTEMRQTTLSPLQPSASSYYPSKEPPPVPTHPFLCIPWPLVRPSPFLSLTWLLRGLVSSFQYILHTDAWLISLRDSFENFILLLRIKWKILDLVFMASWCWSPLLPLQLPFYLESSPAKLESIPKYAICCSSSKPWLQLLLLEQPHLLTHLAKLSCSPITFMKPLEIPRPGVISPVNFLKHIFITSWEHCYITTIRSISSL